jgi:amidase
MNSSAFKPAFATAAETTNAVLNKRISATELLNLEFQRIDRYNPKLNAIVWQSREQALARAKQADAASSRVKPQARFMACQLPSKNRSPIAGRPTPGVCLRLRTQ